MASPASETLRWELLRCLSMARVGTAQLVALRFMVQCDSGGTRVTHEQRYHTADKRPVTINAARLLGMPDGKVVEVWQPARGKVTFEGGRLTFVPAEAGETSFEFAVHAAGVTHRGKIRVDVADDMPPIQWTTSAAIEGQNTADNGPDVLPIHGARDE